MFDNRWDNWAGDFADSFAASQIDPAMRNFVPEVLAHFGSAVRKIDPAFPDEVRSGTFATVFGDAMPRLNLPEAARPHVPEVVACYFEYLQETGRVGEGDEWAAQVRVIAQTHGHKAKPGGGVEGVTIRRSEKSSPLGRNDPCPCGSGKKYKKCCHGQ